MLGPLWLGPDVEGHLGGRHRDGSAAQRIVDTYAVQHATNPDRRNRQSVALHQMSLCASLEQEISGTRSRPAVVNGWATSTWTAWSAHHDTVRAWLARAMQASA